MKFFEEYGEKSKLEGFPIEDTLGFYWKVSALCQKAGEGLLKRMKGPVCLSRDWELELQVYRDGSWGHILVGQEEASLEKGVRTLLAKSVEILEETVCKEDYCLVTGNETEAVWAVMKGKYRGVVLVREEDFWYFSGKEYPKIQREFDCFEESEFMRIPELEGIQCFYGSGRKKYPVHGMLDVSGSEGTLFEVEAGKKQEAFLLKYYSPKGGHHKDLADKLRWMVKHPPDHEAFAWPVDLVYSGLFGRVQVGYLMKKLQAVPMERCFLSTEVSPFDRLCLSVNLVKNALFLHQRGILVMDYNPRNFAIDPEGRLLMLDCGGYIVKNWGSTRKPPLIIEEKPDYSTKTGAVQAEYRYLAALVFYILSRGDWPYTLEGEKVSALEGTEETYLYGEKIGRMFREIFTGKRLWEPERILITLLKAAEEGFPLSGESITNEGGYGHVAGKSGSAYHEEE